MPIMSIKIDIAGILKEVGKINNVPVIAEHAIRRYIDEDAEPAFLKTIETWGNKPVFNKSVTASVNAIIGQVWTDDNVYHILDGGAKPHTFGPKNAPFLRFQSGFAAKTKPKFIGSQSGGKNPSSPWVHALSVDHPGLTAREFAKTIAEDTQPKIADKFREELRKL